MDRKNEETLALAQAQKDFYEQRQMLKRAINHKVGQAREFGHSLNVKKQFQASPWLATGACLAAGMAWGLLTRRRSLRISDHQLDNLALRISDQLHARVIKPSTHRPGHFLSQALSRALLNPTALMTLANVALGMVQARQISDQSDSATTLPTVH